MKNKVVTGDSAVIRKAQRKTLISFGFLFVFFAGCIFLFLQVKNGERSNDTPRPLRTVLNFNESIWGLFFSSHHLAPEFEKSAAVKKPKVNGDLGMGDHFDPYRWKLRVVKDGGGDTLFITLDELKSLPETDVIFNFKCIEGWSQITWWGGVRLSDFIKKYGLGIDKSGGAYHYMGLETPDKEYYVGIDMESCLHPQTILCYEMNGKPLPFDQGAPLRLIIPVKYGIKHLKRIGTMFFSNSRPRDYWYEQGYDYYAGL